MNPKVRAVFTNWKIVLALVCMVLALVAIHPVVNTEGVTIKTISKNSSAELAGMIAPKASLPPVSKDRVLAVNQKPIMTVADYFDAISGLQANDTVSVRTAQSDAPYVLVVKEITEIVDTGKTEFKTVTQEVFNETLNMTRNVTTVEEVPVMEVVSLGPEDIGIGVTEAPTSNLRKGLDLQGGTRVILKPVDLEKEVTAEDMQIITENMQQRLNVFGISDVVIRTSKDLEGNTFVVVEIAGANEEEVQELLAKQGKFESKIGNDTVFSGGKDITYVCMTADCAGIDPTTGCQQAEGGYLCRFRFAISLSPEAAQRQADLTKDLGITGSNLGGQSAYLEKPLDLYLDDELVDTLNIGSELRGRAVTDISITGSGAGIDRQSAMNDALTNMRRMQSILKTGSLPVKLDIVKADTISPSLGKEFLANALNIVLFAILGVIVVVFVGYRRLKVVAAMVLTMLSEILLLLGFAAVSGWNLDIAAIAGIIIAVGTGVDHQIVIVDETLSGQKTHRSWKQRIKAAFSIIFGAYITTVVAMLFLVFAGAGLLRGFAVTTIVGVTMGVLITRPAFAELIEILLKE